MYTKIRRFFSLWPLSLLISALLTGLPFAFMKIYYMYGDDYLMNYIANGSYGSLDSDHLVFPRMLFGTACSLLYGMTKNVNWYCVLLVGSIAVSYAVFHYLIARNSSNPFALGLSLLLNAVTVPMVLTFTSAAFLSVAAGAALLFFAASEKHSIHLMVFGVILAIWGYCIRSDTLLPGFCMFGPAALHYLICFIRSRKTGEFSLYLRNFQLLMISAVCAAAILFGLHIWEKNAYSTEIWSAFSSYNYARGEALDYPGVSYDQFSEAYQNIGFSQEEYTLMYRWSFAEKQAFSENKFLQIAAINQTAYSIDARIDYLKSNLGEGTGLFILLIPYFIWLLFVVTDRSFSKFIGFLEALCLSAVLAALCFIRLRFLLRVAVPLGMIDLLVMALFTKDKPTRRSLIPTVAASALMIALFALFADHFFAAVAGLRSETTYASSQAALDEVRTHPERIYVTDSYAFGCMYYYGHPIQEIKTIDDYSHVIRSGSWDSFSERYYDILDGLNFKDPDNLLSSLLTEENIYLLSDNGSAVAAYLQSISEKKIGYTQETVGDGSLYLFRFYYEDE